MTNTMTMFAPGTRVTHAGRPSWGTGTVVRCPDFMGGDGRHWVRVDFSGWRFHAESRDLRAA